MVCHSHIIRSAVCCQTPEKVVAQFACSHFHAYFMPGSVCFRVKGGNVQPHVQFVAKPAHECLVAFRFFAAQMEITMSRLALVAERKHYSQKSHRISSAAQGYKHGSVFSRQGMAGYRSRNFLFKVHFFGKFHLRHGRLLLPAFMILADICGSRFFPCVLSSGFPKDCPEASRTRCF